MEKIFIGIFIGIILGRFLFPIFESLLNSFLFKIDESKNISDDMFLKDNSSLKNPIGFAYRGDENNGKKEG